MQRYCPTCDAEVEGAGYDPGCQAPICSRAGCLEERGPWCTASCWENQNEAAAEREYEDWHAGEGPVPIEEQCRAAWKAKEGL